MSAYYNEVDPYAAAWLRQLIKDGLLADGDVDERPIESVRADDVRGFTQCHFFAGIGGWSYALRLGDWPDDRPVWTGSCPCQPFSSAGKRKGVSDARHLWPEFRRLIAECCPSVVFGEQVASKAGRAWLSGVFTDLEALAYRRAGADLCAAGVGAWHIRQRLWWVADRDSSRFETGKARQQSAGLCTGGMGDNISAGLQERIGNGSVQRETLGSRERQATVGASDVGRLAKSNGGQSSDEDLQRGGRHLQRPEDETAVDWSDVVWLHCRDGKHRPTQPGLFPLAHGVPSRMGRLRGYGNAIVPHVAAAFIEAYCSARRGGAEVPVWGNRPGPLSAD